MNKNELFKIQISKYILCEGCQSDSIKILKYRKTRKRGEYLYCECRDCSFTFNTPVPVLKEEHIVADIKTRLHILNWDKQKGMLHPFGENELKLLKTRRRHIQLL